MGLTANVTLLTPIAFAEQSNSTEKKQRLPELFLECQRIGGLDKKWILEIGSESPRFGEAGWEKCDRMGEPSRFDKLIKASFVYQRVQQIVISN